ncbi:MAG: DUF3990 domain-containing protein, partial [Parasporobacterium sp.]|nr:DUF3990 domain-containing protein [Parasporobacterium sp.]
MLLYHGSNVEVKHPEIAKSRKKLDFGQGFYTTNIESQAVKWSERFKAQGDDAVVSIYELDDRAINECRLLKFDSYNSEWLDFIVSCREG